MHDDDVSRAGRYRGLCGVCRPIVAAEQKQRRAARPLTPVPSDGLGDEIKGRARRRGMLRRAIEDLAPLADRLEGAVEERDISTMRARAAVRDFREGLQLVGRVAQSLINASPSRNGDSDDG